MIFSHPNTSRRLYSLFHIVPVIGMLIGWLCLISIYLLPTSGIAQVEPIQIFLPPEYEKTQNRDRSATIQEVFYAYSYVSDTVSLLDFKKKVPTAILPDTMYLQVPNLMGFENPTLLMGYLRKEGIHKSDDFILLLVGNYNTNKVTFFIDKNLDGDYLNDGAPTVLKARKEPYQVSVFPEKNRARSFWLQVPKQKSVVEEMIIDLTKEEKIIANAFAFEIYGGVGSNKLTYQFDDLNSGFPVWYTVSQSEKNIGLALSYDFPFLRVGVSATFQDLFQYTSYLNTRFAERETIIDPTTQRTIIRENVQVDRNIDDHARSKVQWGTFIAGRIRFRKFMELQPLINVGQVSTFPNEYLADTRINIRAYELPANSFLELGIRFEGTTSSRRALFFGISRSRLWWEPTDFLEEGQVNFRSKSITWKIMGGYRFARRK